MSWRRKAMETRKVKAVMDVVNVQTCGGLGPGEGGGFEVIQAACVLRLAQLHMQCDNV